MDVVSVAERRITTHILKDDTAASQMRGVQRNKTKTCTTVGRESFVGMSGTQWRHLMEVPIKTSL